MVMVVVMMAVMVVVLGTHGGNWSINVHFLHDEMLHAEHLLEVPIGTADILSWRRRRWRWRHGSGGGFRWEANLVRLWRWDGVRGWRVPLPRQHVLRAHASCRGDRRNRMRAGGRHNPLIHTLAALAVMPIRRRRGRGSARALGGDGSTKHPPGRCGGYTRTRR